MGALMDVLGGAADVLSLPQRAVWKGISGLTGRDWKGTADVLADVGGMDRDAWLTKGLGFAGDMALDPLTYMGAVGGGQLLAKGASKGAGALRGLLSGAAEGAASLGDDAARAASGLTHFTTPDAAANILGTAGSAEGAGLLGGRGGVFALPAAAEAESPFWRGVVRAGIPSSKAQAAVPIPDAALEAFQKTIPLGPFSSWKALGGAHFTRPGTIDMATGAFSPTGSLFKPYANLYGKDMILHAGLRAPDLLKGHPHAPSP
jgi:hypothetical protein